MRTISACMVSWPRCFSCKASWRTLKIFAIINDCNSCFYYLVLLPMPFVRAQFRQVVAYIFHYYSTSGHIFIHYLMLFLTIFSIENLLLIIEFVIDYCLEISSKHTTKIFYDLRVICEELIIIITTNNILVNEHTYYKCETCKISRNFKFQLWIINRNEERSKKTCL